MGTRSQKYPIHDRVHVVPTVRPLSSDVGSNTGQNLKEPRVRYFVGCEKGSRF